MTLFATERLLATAAPSIADRTLAAATLLRLVDGIWVSTVVEGKLRVLPPWLEEEMVAAAVGYLAERVRLAKARERERNTADA
jgi:hypothetical protein